MLVGAQATCQREPAGRGRTEPDNPRANDRDTGTGDGTATLAGKPDLIAVKGNDAVIIDAKTGRSNPTHTTQIMVYQYAFPKSLEEYRGIEFRGHVAYLDANVGVPPRRWTGHSLTSSARSSAD